MSTDKSLYRVWPDGWVQDASEEPHSWRSDDFMLLAAEDEDAALAEFMRLERDYGTHITPSEAARELRRLYAENAALQKGYDAAVDALKDMAAEFRALDLPYGSKAYAKAIAVIYNHPQLVAPDTPTQGLQQVYDARQLEIDHLRGATKMMEPAQPVAWLVYLPSIDTQNVYASQDDPGYVDDVTNHDDAVVTPLYAMAAPKAEVAPAGEYPPLPDPKFTRVVDGIPCITLLEHGLLMRAYVDADRAMRAQAAPENIRSILVRCRDFIDTTQVPAYPAGADLADEIDMVLATQFITQPVARGDALTPAARDVLAERQRQISTEGWTSEHDDKEHLPGELALAAASYVCADEQDAPPAIWPWDWSWWKPRDRRSNLVKSGALILAEIERIDRSQAKEGQSHD